MTTEALTHDTTVTSTSVRPAVSRALTWLRKALRPNGAGPDGRRDVAREIASYPASRGASAAFAVALLADNRRQAGSPVVTFSRRP